LVVFSAVAQTPLLRSVVDLLAGQQVIQKAVQHLCMLCIIL